MARENSSAKQSRRARHRRNGSNEPNKSNEETKDSAACAWTSLEGGALRRRARRARPSTSENISNLRSLCFLLLKTNLAIDRCSLRGEIALAAARPGLRRGPKGTRRWAVIEYLQKGGLLMWPILICSIISIAVIAERLFYLHRATIHVGEFLKGLANLIKRRNFAEALHESAGTPGPVARVIHAAIIRHDLPRSELREIVQEAG